jgi:hypothetical protein
MPKKKKKSIHDSTLEVPLVQLPRKLMHEHQPLLARDPDSPLSTKNRYRKRFYSGRSAKPKEIQVATVLPSGDTELPVPPKESPIPAPEPSADVKEGVLIDLSNWLETPPEITESVLNGDLEILRQQFAAVLQHGRKNYHHEVEDKIAKDRKKFAEDVERCRTIFEKNIAKDRAQRAELARRHKQSFMETLKSCKSATDLFSQNRPSFQSEDVPPRRQSELAHCFEGVDMITFEESYSEVDLIQF